MAAGKTPIAGASFQRWSPVHTSGLLVALRARAGVTETGGAVSDWNGINGVNGGAQSTSTKRPVFTASWQNGQSALALDGGDSITRNSFAAGDPTTATVYFVGQRGNGTQYLFDGGPLAGSSSGRMACYVDNASVNIFAGITVTAGTAIPVSTKFLGRFVFAAGASSGLLIEAHGAATISTSGNCGNLLMAGYTVGERFSGTEGLNGNVAEFYVYSGAVAAADDARIRGALRATYGIVTL